MASVPDLRPRFRSHLRPGFTLLELLVVISIIAVLAALLLPAISMVRQMALATRCASNIRQIDLGARAYSQDWDGLLLPVTSGVNNGYWSFLLVSYLETTAQAVLTTTDTREIMRSCPAWKNSPGYLNSIAVGSSFWCNGGYGLTAFTIGKMPAKDPVTMLCRDGTGNLVSGYGGYSVHAAGVTKVSDRVCLSDGPNYALWPAFTTLSVYEPNFDRHRGKSNSLYYDGHMAIVAKADLKASVELPQ